MVPGLVIGLFDTALYPVSLHSSHAVLYIVLVLSHYVPILYTAARAQGRHPLALDWQRREANYRGPLDKMSLISTMSS